MDRVGKAMKGSRSSIAEMLSLRQFRCSVAATPLIAVGLAARCSAVSLVPFMIKATFQQVLTSKLYESSAGFKSLNLRQFSGQNIPLLVLTPTRQPSLVLTSQRPLSMETVLPEIFSEDPKPEEQSWQ